MFSPVMLRQVQSIMSIETTYSNLRENLASVLAKADADNEVFIVRRRKGRDIALIPADELASILETAHLLSSPANARRLKNALRRAGSRQTASSTIEDYTNPIARPPSPTHVQRAIEISATTLPDRDAPVSAPVNLR